MILFILEAKIFDKILSEVLHSEISLNLSSVEGFFSFGIKARKDELVSHQSCLFPLSSLKFFPDLLLLYPTLLCKN